MTDTRWTYETLLTNGWFGQWIDDTAGAAPYTLRFTFYRSEISIHTVVGSGATEAEAIADAVDHAHRWLRDHPGYQPRRP
jgi:hypothetical protein